MLSSLVFAVNIQPEFTFQRLEQVTGFDILRTNMRITKYNRTTAVMNGTVDFYVDLDNSLTFQMKLAYSRLGNNQFNLYPLRLAEAPFCHFLNDTFREYQADFQNATNFPQVGPEGLCPVPAGQYWLKNVVFDASRIPFIAPEGYWRVTFVTTGPKSTVLFHIYAKLSKESFW
ncbi:uncharacterized protein LOC134206399 [Armigeres subalbatus]|uniref:uncharacterized protein LOC134206399 n=1 Tax=Armigeres subalbatus TaxID=124917 RepID=UPI002ECFFEBB